MLKEINSPCHPEFISGSRFQNEIPKQVRNDIEH